MIGGENIKAARVNYSCGRAGEYSGRGGGRKRNGGRQYGMASGATVSFCGDVRKAA